MVYSPPVCTRVGPTIEVGRATKRTVPEPQSPSIVPCRMPGLVWHLLNVRLSCWLWTSPLDSPFCWLSSPNKVSGVWKSSVTAMVATAADVVLLIVFICLVFLHGLFFAKDGLSEFQFHHAALSPARG